MSCLLHIKRLPQPQAQLLCFHHAGGSASFYFNWKNKVKKNVSLMAIQLPGRDNRISEPFLLSFDVVLDEIIEAIRPYLSVPIIFFGHSLGAYISFEVARKLQQDNMTLPRHLVLSGARPPQFSHIDSNLHSLSDHLSDKEFIEELKVLGGFSEAVLQDQKILNAYIPRLRADWKLFLNYKFNASTPRLRSPLTILNGLEDTEIKYEQVTDWEQCTVKLFSTHFFPGNHFFINSCQEEILTIINQCILYNF